MLHRSLQALPWTGTAPGEPTDLPDTYGVDVLMLAPVDPSRLFATWQLAWPTRNRLVEALGEDKLALSRMVLRIHADPDDEVCSEVDVSGPSRSWYVDFEGGGRRIWAEIGCKDPEGYFYPVARSAPVDIPWDRPSRRSDPDWVPVGELYERLARAVGLKPEALFSSRGTMALAEGRDERLGRNGVPGRN